MVIYVSCLNGLKLRQSDLWDHVNYGRIIIEVGEMPETEPLLPLASKDAFINPAWGSQLLMALCIDSPWLGLAGMQVAHSLQVLLCIAFVGYAVRRKSQSVTLAVVAACLFLYVNWQQFLVVRPQTLGVLFYAALFAILNLKLDRRRSIQILIVISFVVWANLHGSFTMGLFLIGIVGIGRLIDFTWRCRQISNHLPNSRHKKNAWRLLQALLTRSGFTALLVLGISCAIAVLINPFGISVYEEVLRVGGHPNMKSMNEWRPLNLSMKQGQAAAWAFAAIVICGVCSRRRLKMQNVLLLLLLGGLMLWSSRMINWWSPVAAYFIGIHGASALKRFRLLAHTHTESAEKNVGLRHTICAVVAAIVIFIFSPLGRQSFGYPVAETELVEGQTPLKLAAFVSQFESDLPSTSPREVSLLQNLVFCPAEWTGYLTSATKRMTSGNAAGSGSLFPLQPMVSTHVHVIPPALWDDFLRLHYGRPSSSAVLQKYQIDTVIIDQGRQQKLAERIKESKKFEMMYSDSVGQVWRRIKR